MMKEPLCRAAGLLVVPLSLAAQQPGPLVTDRPDQTESAATVPRGFAQIELGALRSSERTAGRETTIYAISQALVRIGVHRRVEARLGFEGWMRGSSEGTGPTVVDEGAGNTHVGVKVRLLDAGVGGPEVAVLGTVVLPTGADAFRVARAEPELRVSASYGIGDRVGAGVNVGVVGAWEEAATGLAMRGDLFYTAVVGAGLAPRVGVFLEAFGALAPSDGRVSTHSLDGGMTFLVRDGVQLDLAGGFGLNEAAEDWFAGAGVSVRVPR